MENVTKFLTEQEAEKNRKWFVLDAAGLTLGRLASEVASVIKGKNKPQYTPHNVSGDGVIVLNASKIVLTGSKLDDKMYYKHTGFIGEMKVNTAKELLAKKPEFLIEQAVFGMLPKGNNGQHMHKLLKVYSGAEHPHKAQQPVEMKLRYS